MSDHRLPQWELAVASLMESPHLVTAATNSGVSVRTMQRWLGEPEFQALLAERSSQAFSVATSLLRAVTIKAVRQLDLELNRADASLAKIKAIQVTFDSAAKLIDLLEVQRIIRELADKIDGQKAGSESSQLMDRLNSLPIVNGNKEASNGNGKHN